MTPKPPEITLNLELFLDDLLNEMGFLNLAESQKTSLKKEMGQNLNDRILEAVALSVETKEVERILQEHSAQQDLGFLATELLKISPQAQEAVLEALERFWDQTLKVQMALA